MPTSQEVFDKVVKHLLTQKKTSSIFSGYGGCVYRGPDGLKCAIGALIPDEMYKPEMEHRGVMEVICEHPELVEHLGKDHSLLMSLQRIHDAYSPNEWETCLKNTANAFCLTWNYNAD